MSESAFAMFAGTLLLVLLVAGLVTAVRLRRHTRHRVEAEQRLGVALGELERLAARLREQQATLAATTAELRERQATEMDASGREAGPSANAGADGSAARGSTPGERRGPRGERAE